MSTARWTEGAACKPQDLELFFPLGRPGRFGDPHRDAAAKAICARCDIRELCLTKALEEEAGINSQRWGIRGGLDAGERAALVEGGAA
jgi:WhiB family redox-sensing transcriptional regulator